MKKKEIFILLPLILISSLLIYFINPKQSNTQNTENDDTNIEESQDSNKKIPLKLFGGIESIDFSEKINNISNIFSNEEENSEENTQEENTQEENINSENETQNDQSIDEVLAEAEKMTAEILSNIENPEECKTCGNSAENNEWMEEELSRVGYLTWKDYFSSENYKLGLEYYFMNKDDLWNQEESDTLCSTVFLAAAGGAPCSCDNAMGPCYTDTAYGRIWHCGGACCCACCMVCCR